MEGLSEQEQKFFESGGKTEVEETEVETETEPVETKVEVKPEVKTEEKKRPSKFEYSPDTDNVVDDLGRKYVPLPAVQSERNENKKLRAELEELKTKWTGGEQKLNKLMEAIQGKQDAPPDYDKDPLGHLSAKNKALEEKIAALEKGQGKMAEESVQQQKINEFATSVRGAEKAFSSQNPDYGDAVSKVHEVWRAELELAGVPDNFIESALARKGAQFTHAALQKEQNPAEAVYKLALRYGYKKAEQKEEKKESADKDKLKTIAQGQEAEKSLASGKGGAEFSLEAIASMSDEDMEAFVSDPKNWKKLSRAAA